MAHFSMILTLTIYDRCHFQPVAPELTNCYNIDMQVGIGQKKLVLEFGKGRA